MTIERLDFTADPAPVTSRCVVHGGMIYLGGLSAAHAGADAAAQMMAILDLVDHYLGRTGSDKSKILTVQVWLADMEQFGAMNAVWNAWVDRSHPPLRACVHAELAAPGALVEIMVTAAR